ncbi:unnamed protein product [Closterium sp. NIES-54]
MTLRPSTAPQRVPLPSPPASSLPAGPDPASDSLRAASLAVTRFLATAVTDPLFESTAASALVTELVDFAAACRLDYATSLVAESASASVCPPSVGGTYVDEVPPTGANIISGMWIFRAKRPPGSPPAFKARYVARGFSQRQGVDFFQTFSPTPKMTTLQVPLHVAAQRDYELHSLEFSKAFLQGSLHEEIWQRRPPGFTGSFPAGTQWSLRRPVYGLRQAPREWHNTLRTTLATLGFAPSTSDPSLILRTDTTLPPFYVLVYVDDLVFAIANTEALAHVKSELQKRHTCTDLGELTSYLGLRINRDRAQRTITLTQSHMVQQVLQRFGFTYSSPQSTPLPTGHSLSAPPSNESVEPSGPYPELVGCLMYLMTCTRPDLAYPLSLLARYVAPGRHRKVHWDATKRVLRYLCSTSGMGLVLGGRARVVLTGHADASWVDDLATQRSSQGYTFSLGSGSVSWRSTRSSSVLSSSSEAEIYAGAMAAQELRWLTYLLTDLGEAPRSPPDLYVDNKAMLALCQEHRLEHRTKHIALRYFLARELQQRGQLRLAYVASQANTADVFTKALQPLLMMERGLWGFFDGTEKKPDNESGIAAWKKKDQKTFATLISRIGKNSRELGAHILARNAFYTVKMRAGESMHEYATRVEELGETFMDLGGTVTEEDWILTLLCGLPEEWSTVITTLDSVQDTWTKEMVVGRLLHEESRRRQFANESDGAAMFSGGSSGKKSTWSKSATKKSFGGSDRSKRNTSNGLSKCHYCGKAGHFWRECRKRPSDWTPSKARNHEGNAHTASGDADDSRESIVLLAGDGTNTPSDAWFLDTGATQHMTHSASFLTDVGAPRDVTRLVFGNDKSLPVVGVGSTRLIIDGGPVDITNGDVTKAIQEWAVEVWDDDKKRIKAIRTDGGGEFVNVELEKWMKSKGIKHDVTTPYTPQHNGAAERLNRTLVEAVRSLLQHSKLGNEWWGEASALAAWIRNHVPTKVLPGTTPFEAWTGTKPNLSRLHTFGCLCYYHVPDPLRHKLQPKARAAIYLGIAANECAWRVWDLGERRVITSRDMVFDEDKFPTKEQPTPQLTVVLPAREEDESMEFPSQVEKEAENGGGGNEESDDDVVEVPSTVAATSSTPSSLPLALTREQRIRRPNTKYTDYATALASPDAPLWKQAMEKELTSIKENDVFELVDPPKGAYFVGCKWVLKKKLGADGSVERYKARLVAQGYTQREGEHYSETFAPVAKATTLWVLLALTASLNLEVEQLDVCTAFLYGLLMEEVYMRQPPEYDDGSGKGAYLVGCKWVLKKKLGADGSVERYKARLVAQGYTQREGEHYSETFAPVAKATTLWVLLALTASLNLEVEQLDVCTAFLYGLLMEEVYMRQPPEYDDGSGKVWKLKRTLYGLKQSPRGWYKRIDDFLLQHDFARSECDSALYVLKEGEKQLVLLLYVDDLLLFSDSNDLIREVKQRLGAEFAMRNLGLVTYYLGMHVDRDRANGTIHLHQEKYVKGVLESFGMGNSKPVGTSLATGFSCLTGEEESTLDEPEGKRFHWLVGSLMYATVSTRPDLAYAAGVLGRVVSNPHTEHVRAGGRVLRYLRGTPNLGLVYEAGPIELKSYADSDYVGDPSMRKSTSGYVSTLLGAARSLGILNRTQILFFVTTKPP